MNTLQSVLDSSESVAKSSLAIWPMLPLRLSLLQLLGHLLSEAEILEKLVQSITTIAGIRTASSYKCQTIPDAPSRNLLYNG